VENIVAHNRLYWQAPTSFNDPFDCRPHMIAGVDRRERSRWIKSAVRRSYNLPRGQRLSIARDRMREPTSTQIERLTSGFDAAMAESAVTCFSEIADSALMWAHYAESHTGVCIAYREVFSETDPFFTFPVVYADQRPTVDLTKLRDIAQMQNAVLTKSTDWAYERERRMIIYRGIPGYRPFPPQALVGVIFGLKSSSADREFVEALIRRRGGGISLFEARESRTSFKLNIAPIG
jgi:hypothetical protein